MQEDRFFEAFRNLVRRVLDEVDEVDYRALYPARVVQWQESGINPSGLVDVVFISDDVGRAATLLKSKAGVPVLPTTPGLSFVPQPGTQVLIGWQGGDERYPYALAWLGLGGAASSETVVDEDFVVRATTITHDADLTDATGDLRSQHELGTSAGLLSATPATPIVSAATALGTDTAFRLTFSVAASQVLSAGSKIADVQLGRDFSGTLLAIAGLDSGGPWPPASSVLCSANAPKTISLFYNGPTPINGPLAGLTVTVFPRGNT